MPATGAGLYTTEPLLSGSRLGWAILLEMPELAAVVAIGDSAAITVYWSDRVRGCDTCTVHALGPFTPRALSRTLAISLPLLAAPCGHATRARCVTAESGCALSLRAWR